MCGQMQVDAGWAIDRAHDALVKRSDVVDDLPNIVSGRSPPIPRANSMNRMQKTRNGSDGGGKVPG